MIRSTRKLLAAFIAAAMLMVMTACSNYKQYEHLKTDIVGVWCEEGGPVLEPYIGEDGLDYSTYYTYEFTSTGQLVYHYTYAAIGGTSHSTVDYSITDNILDVKGAKCRIDIQDGILTMTNNESTTRYRRMSMEEIIEYAVDVQDEQLKDEKDLYIISVMEENYGPPTAAPEEEPAGDETEAAQTEAVTEVVSSEDTQADAE